MTHCPKIAKEFQIDCKNDCCKFDDKFIYHDVIGSGTSDSFVINASYNNQPVAVKISIGVPDDGDFINQLEYESRIYEEIINNLCIGKHMSPNFVWYIGTSICRDIKFTNRYSDQEKRMFFEKYDEIKDKYKYIYGNYDPPTTKLLVIEGLSKFQSVFNYINENVITETKMKSILFQLLYNLYLMQNMSLHHYDMHMGNVALELDTSKLGTLHTHDVCYQLRSGGGTYKINVKNNLIKLFDWDFGYHRTIGKNDLLNGYLCDDYQRCNKYTLGWDTKHALINILHDLSKSPNKMIVKPIMIALGIRSSDIDTWMPYGNNNKIELKFITLHKLLGSSYFDEFKVANCNGVPKENIFSLRRHAFTQGPVVKSGINVSPIQYKMKKRGDIVPGVPQKPRTTVKSTRAVPKKLSTQPIAKQQNQERKSNYNTLTVVELRLMCKDKGIKGYSRMNKAELIKHCGDGSPKRSPSINSSSTIQISNKSKPTPKECDEWLKNKSVNPRNRRPIPKNGRIEKVLKENCKEKQHINPKRSIVPRVPPKPKRSIGPRAPPKPMKPKRNVPHSIQHKTGPTKVAGRNAVEQHWDLSSRSDI